MPAIILIGSCTARKRLESDANLRASRIGQSTTPERLADWVRRIRAAKRLVPARELYCGDSWSILLGLENLKTKTATVDLWVASAGFGLLHSSAKIAPYSATFSRGQEDSVLGPTTPPTETELWWEGLTRSNAQSGLHPAKTGELADQNRNTPIVVAVSPAYLNAMRSDLLAAREALNDPALLTIISTGCASDPEFKKNLLPCDARLQALLGGARTSLNARIARHIVSHYPHERIRCDYLSRSFKRLLARQSEIPTYNRKIVTDDDVVRFIRASIKDNPITSHTKLLRSLREQGMACEQKRFRRLFKQRTENLND